MKSILDPQFKYRNAASTDIRKTFERIRRERRLTEVDAPHSAKVVASIARGKRIPSRTTG